MMQDPGNIAISNAVRLSKSAPSSPAKPVMPLTRSESLHVTHKVPVGDTPYVKAKRVQLVDKDPEKAIALFWAAINGGDRVDSALKDMAIVMKQQNRAEEAIEAIKSLRNRCSDQAQESLDNILLDLYKRCGRLDDQIALLKHKLLLIQQGLAFNGNRTKTARSQGRKFQVSVEQEATWLLGNLGWALMQKENYIQAEEAYRRALLIGADNNKMCNLGICLMKQGRIAEARETLKQVKPAVIDALRGADSHLKAYERAQEMLKDLESKKILSGNDQKNWMFIDSFLCCSSIWQPQPCIDNFSLLPPLPVVRGSRFADENVLEPNRTARTVNALNIDAPPFYAKTLNLQDPLTYLKRTRSGALMDRHVSVTAAGTRTEELENRRQTTIPPVAAASTVAVEEKAIELPDDDAFNEAMLAAVLAPMLDKDENIAVTYSSSSTSTRTALCEGKMGKRLRVFQDITQLQGIEFLTTDTKTFIGLSNIGY